MNLEDYRLNAYSAGAGQNKKLVHKPVFENVNSAIDRIEKQNKEHAERQNIEQAKIAAKTGTWFEKKKSATSDDVKNAAKNLTSGGLVKIPASSTEKDSIYRRVAKFLVIVGIDEAAKILPHLTEEQTEKIIPEIASIQKITPEESASILEEFESLVEKAREEGGLETARNILTKAYGSEKAEDMLKKSVKYPDGKPFDYLSDANAERIKVLIDGESDAVKSLVLSQIEPKKAAKVINLMDVDDKKKIVLRLAKIKPVAPEVLAEIDRSLHEKLLTQNTENSQNMDGRGVLAQILKRMNPSVENSIINTLSEQDPELGEDLRKRLFTEEDVIGSDDRFIQNYLHDMEDRDIAVLIYGKNDAFREKILSNVSKNRRRVILDEESMVHHLTKSDSEKMTSSFYSVLRRAWENGDLRVSGRDEGEVYV
ncbi:MAG: flagellar motor switch protein FliG [Treponema succinifaciens]|uniref:flagellar motor switch protein FliG n=2 Tax=Treponema succinifaciens TaxID=167 RepID=UPI002355F5C0|nr:flagellar motor switch protein FliG [Treponema succinifaciens]MCI6911875.1 flagellar motor switch protein FliG [Treponema succinifaciens]